MAEKNPFESMMETFQNGVKSVLDIPITLARNLTSGMTKAAGDLEFPVQKALTAPFDLMNDTMKAMASGQAPPDLTTFLPPLPGMKKDETKSGTTSTGGNSKTTVTSPTSVGITEAEALFGFGFGQTRG